jgi:hypothetical protein
MTRGRLLLAALVFGLAVFYAAGATMHARKVNLSKARGDQSGYLWDAERVYANWHGQTPPYLIGVRNRMPVYAGFLALLYRQGMSDPQYFEVAREANIYLSLALLAILGFVLPRYLPRHAALNLLGVAAFGWFIFKAGYTQSELPFYTFFFLAFLACWSLLRGRAGPRLLLHAAVAGALCGLAQLTKASLPPFLAVFLFAGGAWALVGRPDADAGSRGHRPTPADRLWRMTALAAFAAAFLVSVWPYISTSKKVYGQYFYNVNSNFYVWYDDWASASVGTRLHGDDVGWPTLPESEMPSASRYWREHSMGQIAARLSEGFDNMRTVVKRDFDLLPYLVLYLGAMAVLLATRRTEMAAMARSHIWELLFFALYAIVYLIAIAFYHTISGTGTGRFLLAHALPFFFVLARVAASERFARSEWRLGSLRLGVRHFDGLVTAVILFNVAVRVWPRLMSTYGGF